MAGGAYGGNRLTRGVVGGGPAVPLYSKGWPGDPTAPVESNVTFQLLLEETSGDLIETVNNIAIPMRKFDAAGDGPQYQRMPIGPEWANFEYGKHWKAFPHRGGWGVVDATLNTALSIDGAQDFVWEAVYNAIYPPAEERCEAFFNTLDWSNTAAGGMVITLRKVKYLPAHSATECQITIQFYSSGGGPLYTATWNFVSTQVLRDTLESQKDELRKLRITYNATTQNVELFINGASQGTRSVAGFNTRTAPAQAFGLGSFYRSSGPDWTFSVVSAFWTTFYTFRLSKNTRTNNFGGPGGG